MQLIRFIRVFIIASAAQLVWINGADAFTCRTVDGQVFGGSGGGHYVTVNVGVSLSSVLTSHGVLVVNLADKISCSNEANPPHYDVIRAESGSTFIDPLDTFTGTFTYYGSSYAFPLTTPTKYVEIGPQWAVLPWQATIYLTPTSAAGGKLIRAGQKFASIKLYKLLMEGNAPFQGGYPDAFTWDLYSLNDVFMPTGTCDVSSRDLTIQLPEYPGNAAIPLTVHCASDQNVAFYLSGNTATSNDIFRNTYSGINSASGVGIQLLRNGSAIPANQNVSLGTVGTSPVSLGLTAGYARTSGQVTAGGVQSIIGVTFVYD